MENLASKAELRRHLLAARRSLAPDVKTQADARILARLADWLQAHPVRVLGAYLAMAGEPDLSALYAALAEQGVIIAMPVVLNKQQPLSFVRWQQGDVLARDASGTLAPAAREQFLMPDAVIAPCVGFTSHNLRLGYGGGYFDRTLAQQPRPKAWGVAYAFTRVSFAADRYDMPLDVIFTD